MLAPVSLVGGRSVLAHQLAECFIVAGAVVAIGFLGRKVAGEHVGVLATLIAAVYPVLWVDQGSLVVESLYALLLTLALLAAYRFWHQPNPTTAAVFGLAVGLAALCRGEGLLYVPLLVVPVVLVRCRMTRRPAIALLAVAVAVALLTLTPWTVRNIVTFKKPILISSTANAVLAGANCRDAYYGSRTGDWVIACAHAPRAGDESEQWSTAGRRGARYARHHLDRLPAVMTVRLARTWEVYPPAGTRFTSHGVRGSGSSGSW